MFFRLDEVMYSGLSHTRMTETLHRMILMYGLWSIQWI
nr:MAG TPA: hypothetical protein [Caudoviricetes sp.]